jgi:hypothetical protein
MLPLHSEVKYAAALPLLCLCADISNHSLTEQTEEMFIRRPRQTVICNKNKVSTAPREVMFSFYLH